MNFLKFIGLLTNKLGLVLDGFEGSSYKAVQMVRLHPALFLIKRKKVMFDILDEIKAHGGRPFFVGGYVRDFLLGLDPKDTDIEVFGLSYAQLSDILNKFGKVDLVGQSFGIIKVRRDDGRELDFSLPRTDSKNGIGHKGFDVNMNANLTPKEAAKRRDFTINSMTMDANGNIYDFFNGQDDLHFGVLNPTSEHFSEDPLRILRGFQFAARFNMVAGNDLLNLPSSFYDEFRELPSSRIWEEWHKWATKGEFYSTSLRYMHDVGLIKEYSHINLLDNLPQDPRWHPEGDVLIHTGLVLDYMGKICREQNITGDERCVLIFSALCHDFGKAITTKIDGDKITAYGHEQASEELALDFLNSIGCPKRIIEQVIPLVGNHMAANQELSDKAVRRLANRLAPANIHQLIWLINADQCGRIPLPQVRSANLNKLAESAARLSVSFGKPEPLIMGRDIIQYIKPGPKVGEIQKKLYDLQLDGEFHSREVGLLILKEMCNEK